MSSMRSTIKREARMVLSESLFKAILIMFIIGFLWVALSSLQYALTQSFKFPSQPYILTKTKIIATEGMLLKFLRTTVVLSAAFSVLWFLLSTPLSLGRTEWYWHLVDRKPKGIEGVFAWLGSLRLYGKSLWLSFSIFLRMLPLGLLTIGVPYGAMLASTIVMGLYPKSEYVFYIGAIVLFSAFFLLLPGLFLLIVFYARYMLAPYLLVEDSSRSVVECIHTSIRYTREKRLQIVAFYFSFLPWALLCVALCFVPMVWVEPYYYTSRAVYARYLIVSGREWEHNPSAGPYAAGTSL